MSGTRVRPRRLPVFFLIDDSAAMIGAMSVAASEGLQAFQRDLQTHGIGVRSVYLSVTLLGDQALTSPLHPIVQFAMPSFQARGNCYLAPGLRHVRRAIDDSIIVDTPEHLRDLHPIVFVILGGPLKDDASDLQVAADALSEIDGPRQPRFFIMTAASDPDSLKMQRRHLLQMTHADGNSMAGSFTWARELVTAVCDMQARGEHDLDLPICPAGIELLS